MQEVSGTLKRYLEALVTKVSPDVSAALISQEEARLSEIKILNELRDNNWISFTLSFLGERYDSGKSLEKIRDAIANAKSIMDFGSLIDDAFPSRPIGSELVSTLNQTKNALDDFNMVRIALGLAPLIYPDEEIKAPSAVEKNKKVRLKPKVREAP